MATAYVTLSRSSSSNFGERWVKKSGHLENGGGGVVVAAPVVASDEHLMNTKTSSSNQEISYGDERTVKKLRLSKALTVPEEMTVSDACRRMAHRMAEAVMLTDSIGLLSGIVSDKDIAMRVIAESLKPEHTIVSKIMTKNPVLVTMDTLAIEALQEKVRGGFRHLPVVENGEAIALLDITKCLYDAILRMEKAAEEGSAIEAAVEGVERQWGSDLCAAQYAFIGTLQERMFKPSLSTILTESNKIEVVSPSESVYHATKRMRENRVISVVVMIGEKPQGILTSKDVLMRVVAKSLSPEDLPVEKVMTANIVCATMDTTILEALHIMHEGRFLHLPVVDRDGCIVACVDVLQITRTAISLVDGGRGAVSDMATTMIQKFWDSALTLESPDEENETHSDCSTSVTSNCGGETWKYIHPSLGNGNSFAFKFEDQGGHMHRFNHGTKSIDELRAAVLERAVPRYYHFNTRLLYIDDEGDKVVLETDDDVVGAVSHAKSAGWKVLRLQLDATDTKKKETISLNPTATGKGRLILLKASVLTGAFLLAGISIMVYLKRSKS